MDIKKFFGFTRRDSEPEPEQKSSVVPYYSLGTFTDQSLYGYALGFGGELNFKRAYHFMETNSSLSLAINKITDAVEMIQPVLRMPDGKVDEQHEILDLLRQPNDHETLMDLVGRLAQDWLLTHNAIFVAIGNLNAPPSSLYSVPMHHVSIKKDKGDGFPSEYKILEGPVKGTYRRQNEDDRPRRRRRGVERRIRYVADNLRELYHIRGRNTRGNSLVGTSPVQALALEIQQQILSRKHNLAVLRQGGRLSLVAIFKDTMNQDQHNERHQSVNEQIGGADNAGKIAVLSDRELELKEMGKTNKDMDFLNLDNMAFKTIMNTYNVPLPIVLTDAATDSNVSHSIGMFYDNAVIPAHERVMNGLSRLLVPRFQLALGQYRLTHNAEEIPALLQRRLEQIKNRKELNLETPNELREMLPNREPLGPEGDVVYQPATLVAMGADQFTDDNTTTAEEEARRQLRMETEENEDPEE